MSSFYLNFTQHKYVFLFFYEKLLYVDNVCWNEMHKRNECFMQTGYMYIQMYAHSANSKHSKSISFSHLTRGSYVFGIALEFQNTKLL